MVKKKSNPQPQKKVVKKFSLNQAIMNLFNQESPIISFIREDGSKLVQGINNAFLYNEYGRRKSISELKNDLFALQHDNSAVRFII